MLGYVSMNFENSNIWHTFKTKKMRILSIIALLYICISCSNTKNATKPANNLNGKWVPVKQEMGGKELPKVVFEKQTLVMNDSNYVFTAESIDKGIVKYSDGKMDIYGKEGVNIGKHFTAIYKLENGQLTICYNLSGKGYPEQFDTKGNPLYFLSVSQKQ